MSWATTIFVVVALPILTVAALVGHRIWADQRTERRLGLNRGRTYLRLERRRRAVDRWAARRKQRRPGRAGRTGEVLAGVHDLSCTLAFAITYVLAPGSQADKLFIATAVFVTANALVFVVSRNFEQGMLLVAWVSRLTIVAMGGLTLWLQDETFIKMNRTLYFGLLAAWSAATVVAGTPRLQRFAFGGRHRDITAKGWQSLTLFSACACAALALVNELIWRNFSTSFWVGFQVWGWVLAELMLLPLAMPLFTRHQCNRKNEESGGAEASQ